MHFVLLHLKIEFPYLESSCRSGKSISSRDSPHDGGRGSNGGTIAIASGEDAARGGDSGGNKAEESKLKIIVSLM